MNKLIRTLFIIAAISWTIPEIRAQWTTQSIDLRTGWNSIYLEVEPADGNCDQLLVSLPVESVWGWNRRFTSVQFLQDPETLLPGQPDWLMWVAENHPGRGKVNLHFLRAGHSYLIHHAGPPMTWEIQGRPIVRRPAWVADSLNLVGFSVDTKLPPTFASFFTGTDAHDGQPIYRLGSSGQWQEVVNPTTTTMRSGEAFWVNSQGASDFVGPFEVSLEQGSTLDYGGVLTEQILRIHNRSDRHRSFLLRPINSQSAPAGQPTVAGPVSLSFFQTGLNPEDYGWVPLNSTLERLDVPPGGKWALRLAVQRREMWDAEGRLFQSQLQVSDESGVRQIIGVTSRGLIRASISGGGVPPPHPHAGLWVGTVVVRKVNEPAHPNPAQQPIPVPTGSEFQFRLIAHVDSAGQVHLLQKILQMWKPSDSKFVLLTDEALASNTNYVGTSNQNGDDAPRRVSTTAFGFNVPILMQGDFGVSNTCQVVMSDDDPLNPFKHTYHPDHDNLDFFSQPLPPGARESFAIQRDLDLEFQPSDPDGLPLSGWGDTWLGGIYRETISGLHREALEVQGIFRMRRVSDVAELNDTQP